MDKYTVYMVHGFMYSFVTAVDILASQNNKHKFDRKFNNNYIEFLQV